MPTLEPMLETVIDGDGFVVVIPPSAFEASEWLPHNPEAPELKVMEIALADIIDEFGDEGVAFAEAVTDCA